MIANLTIAKIKKVDLAILPPPQKEDFFKKRAKGFEYFFFSSRTLIIAS